jgi:hypothetical protein
MHLYKSSKGNILRHEDQYFSLGGEWDELINQHGLYHQLDY